MKYTKQTTPAEILVFRAKDIRTAHDISTANYVWRICRTAAAMVDAVETACCDCTMSYCEQSSKFVRRNVRVVEDCAISAIMADGTFHYWEAGDRVSLSTLRKAVDVYASSAYEVITYGGQYVLTVEDDISVEWVTDAADVAEGDVVVTLAEIPEYSETPAETETPAEETETETPAETFTLYRIIGAHYAPLRTIYLTHPVPEGDGLTCTPVKCILPFPLWADLGDAGLLIDGERVSFFESLGTDEYGLPALYWRDMYGEHQTYHLRVID